ncbi:recombinase family protein [Myxococcus sp. RHSTA-1-4]|uniref:recombinase family protein n=1 Tax=Myxococcus sp. RHSTA-1-4 TaxID=2874601 RepID=UPI001CBCE984|nr:recombinase family protein [Myxococcus sp. RHSTA-1-4]MBZ4419076.1 recombinase family protein [Myxococcus sp. RHSTA-1-4]
MPKHRQIGFRTRKGNLWDKGAVIQTLRQSAAGGVVRWGVRHHGNLRPPREWMTLPMEPTVDAKTYALVKELRAQRRPTELPGRASAKPRVLTGLARCGLCGSRYQLEALGKSLDGATYAYCCYNCRKTLRAGKKACPGFRVRVRTSTVPCSRRSPMSCARPSVRSISHVGTTGRRPPRS